MEKIYSKVNPTKLLHIVQRLDQITEPRVDLIVFYFKDGKR